MILWGLKKIIENQNITGVYLRINMPSLDLDLLCSTFLCFQFQRGFSVA